MSQYHIGRVSRDIAVERSLDAALEVDEIVRGIRHEAPALRSLALLLMGSQPEAAVTKRDLLNNSQFAALYHRAATSSGRTYESASELDPVLDLFVRASEVGLPNFSPAHLEFIRDFCLGLNRELVSESAARIVEPNLSRSRSRNSDR